MAANNKKKNLYYLCLTALFTAAITAATFVHIPAPLSNGGYIHPGDIFVYLSACFLPTPYAAVASALGGGLADGLSGAVMWVIPSVIIKAAMTLTLTNSGAKIVSGRNLMGIVLGSVITVAGYYLAEVIVFGCGFAVPLASVPFNAVQAVGCAALFVLTGLALDKTNIKNSLQKVR